MKNSIPKNEVRAALAEYIKARSDTDRLPPLRTISQELGTSIYLIRKHLDAMQREGILQAKNRVGMFLTASQVQRPTIGIITNPSDSDPDIDSPNIYTGMIYELSCNYLVRAIHFKKLDELPQLVKSLGLAGLAWVEPVSEIFPQLKQLCEKHGIPLVLCGQNLFIKHSIKRFSNAISLDWERLARLRADYFAAYGKRHIVYYAIHDTPSVPIFRQELAKHGIELPDECIIPKAELLETQLKKLQKSYPIDGLLIDGASGFYETLFAYMHSHPDFRPLLSIECHPLVLYLMRQYPEINIDFQFETWQDFYFRLGKDAAKMLENAMDGTWRQTAEKHCPIIIDKHFIQWQKSNKRGKEQ